MTPWSIEADVRHPVRARSAVRGHALAWPHWPASPPASARPNLCRSPGHGALPPLASPWRTFGYAAIGIAVLTGLGLAVHYLGVRSREPSRARQVAFVADSPLASIDKRLEALSKDPRMSWAQRSESARGLLVSLDAMPEAEEPRGQLLRGRIACARDIYENAETRSRKWLERLPERFGQDYMSRRAATTLSAFALALEVLCDSLANQQPGAASSLKVKTALKQAVRQKLKEAALAEAKGIGARLKGQRDRRDWLGMAWSLGRARERVSAFAEKSETNPHTQAFVDAMAEAIEEVAQAHLLAATGVTQPVAAHLLQKAGNACSAPTDGDDDWLSRAREAAARKSTLAELRRAVAAMAIQERGTAKEVPRLEALFEAMDKSDVVKGALFWAQLQALKKLEAGGREADEHSEQMLHPLLRPEASRLRQQRQAYVQWLASLDLQAGMGWYDKVEALLRDVPDQVKPFLVQRKIEFAAPEPALPWVRQQLAKLAEAEDGFLRAYDARKRLEATSTQFWQEDGIASLSSDAKAIAGLLAKRKAAPPDDRAYLIASRGAWGQLGALLKLGETRLRALDETSTSGNLRQADACFEHVQAVLALAGKAGSTRCSERAQGVSTAREGRLAELIQRLTRSALESGRPELCTRMLAVFAQLDSIDAEGVMLDYLSANEALVKTCAQKVAKRGGASAGRRTARLRTLLRNALGRRKAPPGAPDTWESKTMLDLAGQAAGWEQSVRLWRSVALRLQLHGDVAGCRRQGKQRVWTLSYDFADPMQLSDWETHGRWNLTVAGLRPAAEARRAGDGGRPLLVFKYPISVPPKKWRDKNTGGRLLAIAVESTGKKAGRGKWHCVLRKAGEPDFSQREEIKIDPNGLGAVGPPPKIETPFWLGIEHRGGGGVLTHVQVEAALAIQDE